MAKKQYEIRITEAKYNIHKVDTWRIVYKAKPIYGIENWELATDKLFYSLEEAEEELQRIKEGRVQE